MTRAHKTKARADIYENGLRTDNPKNKSGYSLDRSKPADKNDKIIVPKGSIYYWWQFAFGTKQISLTAPKPQQLTRSEYDRQLLDFADRLGAVSGFTEPLDLAEEVQSLIDDIGALRDEQEEKKSNMPEGLQEGPTGELLQERYDNLDSAVSELEGIDMDYDEPEDDEFREEAIEEMREKIVSEDTDTDDTMVVEEVELTVEQEAQVQAIIDEKKQDHKDDWLTDKIDEIESISLG